MSGRQRSVRRPGLAVAVTDALGRRLRQPALVRWLRRAAPRAARGAVTVALVSDARIRALNRRYRGVDRVTDVLAFPMGPEGQRSTGDRHLGDIVIATGRADRQARAIGHAPAIELQLLALHGLLHLLGYDHGADAGQMARVEQRCLRRGGLADGLIGRGDDASSGAGRQVGRGVRRDT